MTAHDAQARSYASTAAAATRRAARDAQTAAEGYRDAARALRSARWLTRHPELQRASTGHTPAQLEHTARVHTAWADSWLRMSWNATDSAEHYRQLAASYRGMHAGQLARLAS